MLALNANSGCHWVVVVHGRGGGVMMMVVMFVVNMSSCMNIINVMAII